MKVTIVVPFATVIRARRRAPSAMRATEQTVLALIDNGKPKAGALLDALGRELQRRGAVSTYFIYPKRAMVPISDEERSEVLARAQTVIAGVGDCGGCTACSTTDALRFREVGVPAHVLATEKFTFLVDATDEAYGLDGLQRLVSQHPIWSRPAEWFESQAAELADQWLADRSSAPKR